MYTFLTILSSLAMLFMAGIILVTDVTLLDKVIIFCMALGCMVIQVLCVTKQFERRVVNTEAVTVGELRKKIRPDETVPPNYHKRSVPVQDILSRFEGYSTPRVHRSWDETERLVTI